MGDDEGVRFGPVLELRPLAVEVGDEAVRLRLVANGDLFHGLTISPGCGGPHRGGPG